ncbi:UNVERIFIED_CONTAM: hypothetical protein FKN15_033935 [Acipenser sinensis]
MLLSYGTFHKSLSRMLVQLCGPWGSGSQPEGTDIKEERFFSSCLSQVDDRQFSCEDHVQTISSRSHSSGGVVTSHAIGGMLLSYGTFHKSLSRMLVPLCDPWGSGSQPEGTDIKEERFFSSCLSQMEDRQFSCEDHVQTISSRSHSSGGVVTSHAIEGIFTEALTAASWPRATGSEGRPITENMCLQSPDCFAVHSCSFRKGAHFVRISQLTCVSGAQGGTRRSAAVSSPRSGSNQ